ncbi:hypothetical protein SEMRO_997_G229410.1 [Seminavis robusta]|uniref:Uncharacterized protein n=1 Tax=Seminavis robusta TaxID=568900 RepID=A0A9N8HL39_9STRA|nr:hypothetical protein SEMRO_997_G229410.1 [Seminavis robusta]|eukprot:Sro997_g229410.1 n/a (177) ;mRNA; r:15168-15698
MKKRYKASLPDIQLGTAVKVKVHSNDIHQSNGVLGIVFKWTPSGGVQIITSVGIVTKQSNKPYIIPANQYLVLPDDAIAVMPELAKLQTDVRASRGVLDRSVYPSIGLVLHIKSCTSGKELPHANANVKKAVPKAVAARNWRSAAVVLVDAADSATTLSTADPQLKWHSKVLIAVT